MLTVYADAQMRTSKSAVGVLIPYSSSQREVVRRQTNRFLSYLPRRLASKIAYENAMRIYEIRE